MREGIIFEFGDIDIGDELILKDGRKAIVTGFLNSMLPTINDIYLFYTNIGEVSPNNIGKFTKKRC